MELLVVLSKERQNKLNRGEYDEASWSTRTWMSWAAQQLSVALIVETAREISHALHAPMHGRDVRSHTRAAA